MALKGRNALIQILFEGSYVTIAGMTTKGISINRETIDLTTDTTGLVWKQLLNDPNASIEISGAAVFKDDLAIRAMENLAYSGETYDFRMVYGNDRAVQGLFAVSNFEYLGQTTDAQRASFTLTSACDVANTAQGFAAGWDFIDRGPGASGLSISDPASQTYANLLLKNAECIGYDRSAGTWLIACPTFGLLSTWRSVDDGVSWVLLNHGQAFKAYPVIQSNNNGVWVLNHGDDYYRSVDDGLTWALVYTAPSGVYLTYGRSKFYDESKNRFIFGGGEYYWYSDDEGLTFTEVNVPGQNIVNINRFGSQYILSGNDVEYTLLNVDTLAVDATSANTGGGTYKDMAVATNNTFTEVVLFQANISSPYEGRFNKSTDLVLWDEVYYTPHPYAGLYANQDLGGAVYITNIGYMVITWGGQVDLLTSTLHVRYSLTGALGTWQTRIITINHASGDASTSSYIFVCPDSTLDKVAIVIHQHVYFIEIDVGGAT